MIVFIFSIYDELKTLRRAQDANSVFHQRCSDAVILFDNMLASVLDKVVIFAGEVLFGRNSRL